MLGLRFDPMMGFATASAGFVWKIRGIPPVFIQLFISIWWAYPIFIQTANQSLHGILRHSKNMSLFRAKRHPPAFERTGIEVIYNINIHYHIMYMYKDTWYVYRRHVHILDPSEMCKMLFFWPWVNPSPVMLDGDAAQLGSVECQAWLGI